MIDVLMSACQKDLRSCAMIEKSADCKEKCIAYYENLLSVSVHEEL